MPAKPERRTTRHDAAQPRRRRRRPGATEAAGYFLEALESSTNATHVAYCLAGLAAAAALGGLVESAGRLWGAVESHQQRLGDTVMTAQTTRRYMAALAQIQGVAFEDAVAAGRELTLEDATREALGVFESVRR